MPKVVKLAKSAIESKLGRPLIFLLGAFVSILCLYLAFRKMDFADFWTRLKTLSWWSILVTLALTQISNLFLAKRWAVLLEPLGKIKYSVAFWSLRISYFFNATLPARLGEPFRLYYVNRKAKIPITKALGAMGADRFLDFTSMLVVLYISVIVLGLRGSLPALKTIGAGIFLLILGIFALAQLPHGARWKWLDKLFKLRANIFEGMSPLLKWRSLRISVPICFISWILHGATVVTFSYAVGEPISLFKAFVVIAGVTVAIAIPSSPGNIGTFELGAITVLRYFGISTESAATIAVLYHMIQLIPTLIVGAYGYYFYFLKLPKKAQIVDLHPQTHRAERI